MTIVEFLDLDTNEVHYGIKYECNIICGCCGGLFELEEVQILDEYSGDFESILKGLMEK